jgi:hypothetical protein
MSPDYGFSRQARPHASSLQFRKLAIVRLSLSLSRIAQNSVFRRAICALAASVTVMGTARDSTIADLPPPDTKRWTIQRKADVVAAVRSGRISLDQACCRYMLSIEEFLTWQGLVDMHGVAGLKVTHTQRYRGLKPTS